MVINMYYLNYFYITSILGFLIESSCYLIFNWSGNSGYLFGPWTPIYGFGAIIIIYIYDFLDKKIKRSKVFKFITFLFIISILLTLIEFIGGHLIEFVFHESLWDYSHHKFNIGKYVSLIMTLVWMGLASLFIYIVRPFIDKFIYVFPKTLTYIVTILFVLDNIVTILLKLKLI